MSKIKVFLSHKHELKDSTKRLQWFLGRLAPERFDFFASSSDISPGEEWRKRVKNEIAKADWLIALTTQCEGKSKDWIVHEISSFCDMRESAPDGDSEGPPEKRCIIIHDEGDRLEVFGNLQQFPATRDGCKDFLQRLLSSGQGCDGFNRYIGDDTAELKKEAERLWEILVASPPPFVLLPKGRFWLTPETESRLGAEEIADNVGVTLDRMAAAIHNIKVSSESNRWKGTFGELRNSMSDTQRHWIPLIAFLLRKVLDQRQIQSAFILYPDYRDAMFYIPVASQLFVYPSGDKVLEFIYVPMETAFTTRNLTQRDQLFHLIVLCINTQWRVLDRYREEVENLAAKERSTLVNLTEEDEEKRTDLNRRILIDLMKIHSESAARGIVNPERILGMFPESERSSVEADFKTWISVFETIVGGQRELRAEMLEESLGKAQEVLSRLLRKYAARVSELEAW